MKLGNLYGLVNSLAATKCGQNIGGIYENTQNGKKAGRTITLWPKPAGAMRFLGKYLYHPATINNDIGAGTLIGGGIRSTTAEHSRILSAPVRWDAHAAHRGS